MLAEYQARQRNGWRFPWLAWLLLAVSLMFLAVGVLLPWAV